MHNSSDIQLTLSYDLNKIMYMYIRCNNIMVIAFENIAKIGKLEQMHNPWKYV